MKLMYIILGIAFVLFIGQAKAITFSNSTVIQPTASQSRYFIADYYNITSLTFEGQPAEYIVINGRYLRTDAAQEMNITITNLTVSNNAMLLSNTSANPSMELNLSGFTASYLVDVLADGIYIGQYTANTSGWVNFVFQNFTGPLTLLQFNQTAPADITAPTFDNIINHTTYVNQSFSYDVDATDPSGIGGFTLNGTNFTINVATGVITNNTALNQTWIEWLNITVNDTVGNLAWKVFYINVTVEPNTKALGKMIGALLNENLFAFTKIEIVKNFDSNMPDNTMYYSYDQKKLVYKDPNGNIHTLY